MSNQTFINRTPLAPSNAESRETSSLQQSPLFIGHSLNTVDMPLPLPSFIGYTSKVRKNTEKEGSMHILKRHGKEFSMVILGHKDKENLDEQMLCNFLLHTVTEENYLGTREQLVCSVKSDTPPLKQTQLYFSLPFMSTKILAICPNPNKIDDDPENTDPRRIRRLITAYPIKKSKYNDYVLKNEVHDESRNRNIL